jgi:hypothetical protein
MTSISSSKTLVNQSADHLFTYLTDLERFRSSLPEQVTNYKVEGNRCSFTIQGMADLSLEITQAIPFEKVIFSNASAKPFPFALVFDIAALTDQSCQVMVTFEGDINPMLLMMAKGPLQTFVNMVAQKLATI